MQSIDTDREDLCFKVSAVREILFGWMYSDELQNKGYLESDDITVWLLTDQRSLVRIYYPI